MTVGARDVIHAGAGGYDPVGYVADGAHGAIGEVTGIGYAPGFVSWVACGGYANGS